MLLKFSKLHVSLKLVFKKKIQEPGAKSVAGTGAGQDWIGSTTLPISLYFFCFYLKILPSWIWISILNVDPDPGGKMNVDPDPEPLSCAPS